MLRVNVVETQNLTKIYESRQIALNGVNLIVPQGSIYGLIGPNGAGKSTALRLVLGLQKPTAGIVKVFGEEMDIHAGHLRKRIGFLPQTGRFPPEMTPISYLDLTGRLLGVSSGERKPRLSALLHAVDLLQASSQRIEHLSSGQRTRLGLAAALMNDPDLLLLDEPVAGVAGPLAEKIFNNLRTIVSETNISIFVIEHNMDFILRRGVDRIIVMDLGKVLMQGTPDEVKDSKEVIEAYLGGAA